MRGLQFLQQGVQGRRPLLRGKAMIGRQPIPYAFRKVHRDGFGPRIVDPSGGKIDKPALYALIRISHVRFVAEHFNQRLDYGNRQVRSPRKRIYRPVTRNKARKKFKDPAIIEYKPRIRKGHKKYPPART
jgi:hypothetical protein